MSLAIGQQYKDSTTQLMQVPMRISTMNISQVTNPQTKPPSIGMQSQISNLDLVRMKTFIRKSGVKSDVDQGTDIRAKIQQQDKPALPQLLMMDPRINQIIADHANSEQRHTRDTSYAQGIQSLEVNSADGAQSSVKNNAYATYKISNSQSSGQQRKSESLPPITANYGDASKYNENAIKLVYSVKGGRSSESEASYTHKISSEDTCNEGTSVGGPSAAMKLEVNKPRLFRKRSSQNINHKDNLHQDSLSFKPSQSQISKSSAEATQQDSQVSLNIENQNKRANEQLNYSNNSGKRNQKRARVGMSKFRPATNEESSLEASDQDPESCSQSSETGLP